MTNKIHIIILSVILAISISYETKAQTTLNLKVFLEGPFNGSGMNTDLNAAGLIPLSQPYNVEPWNYTGTENVPIIPNAYIVDWVVVELRETNGDASTATLDKQIHRQSAFLNSTGNIVDLDGSSMITYSGTISSNLYVIIWHRNHLALMSSGPLSESGGIYSWDFTDQLSKAYLDCQKSIGAAVFGMISGDSDANGTVETADLDPGWYSDAGTQFYAAVDLNLDSQINNLDKNSYWFPNIGFTSKIPTEVPFICGEQLLDIRDDQSYSTVQIGTQCWMAENLNIGIMIIGFQSDNGIIEKNCYNDSIQNCNIYGGLYRWKELMEYGNTPGIQGICPAGWHIPIDTEWCTVTQFIDPTVDCNVSSPAGWSGTDAGIKMKSTNGWYQGGNGTNASGFNALPGGFRYSSGSYYWKGNGTTFWSSSLDEGTSNFAWTRYLDYNSDLLGRGSQNIYYHHSVRCIKD